jgi:hypothetical protein
MANDDLHNALVVICGSVRRAWNDAASNPADREAVDQRLSHVYTMIKAAKHVEADSERIARLDDIMEYIREGK